MTRLIFALAGLVLASAGTMSLGGEIGYIEDFALATDRTAPLKKLIPGTQDYYYYNCLHYQNTEQFDKLQASRDARCVDQAVQLYAASAGDSEPPSAVNLCKRPAGIAGLHSSAVGTSFQSSARNPGQKAEPAHHARPKSHQP